MPSAAAMPARRDTASAVRTTRTKLGPGLTTPTASAPRMARPAITLSMAGAPRQTTACSQDVEPDDAVGRALQPRGRADRQGQLIRRVAAREVGDDRDRGVADQLEHHLLDRRAERHRAVLDVAQLADHQRRNPVELSRAL